MAGPPKTRKNEKTGAKRIATYRLPVAFVYSKSNGAARVDRTTDTTAAIVKLEQYRNIISVMNVRITSRRTRKVGFCQSS